MRPRLRSVTPVAYYVKCGENGANEGKSRDTVTCRRPGKTTKSRHVIVVWPIETSLVRRHPGCPWNTPLVGCRTLAAASSKRQAESDDRIADTGTPRILEVVDPGSRPSHFPVRVTTDWRLEAVGDRLEMQQIRVQGPRSGFPIHDPIPESAFASTIPGCETGSLVSNSSVPDPDF